LKEFVLYAGGKYNMTDDDICLKKGQLQNIVTAAVSDEDIIRDGRSKKPCPHAVEFIKKDLGIGKTRQGKQKRATKDFLEKTIEGKIARKISGWIDGFF
jgi:hypothetical protein